MIYTHAPADFADAGLPYGARCRCSQCGYEGRSTFIFDFYADKPGNPLVCEQCQRAKMVEQERLKMVSKHSE